MNFTRLTQPIAARALDSVAFVSLGICGYWELIALAVFWGSALAPGFCAENKHAPEEQRPRILFDLVLLGVMFSPCVVVAFAWGIFPAVASAWLVWFGLGFMMTLLRHVRGPMVISRREPCGAAVSQE